MFVWECGFYYIDTYCFITHSPTDHLLLLWMKIVLSQAVQLVDHKQSCYLSFTSNFYLDTCLLFYCKNCSYLFIGCEHKHLYFYLDTFYNLEFRISNNNILIWSQTKILEESCYKNWINRCKLSKLGELKQSCWKNFGTEKDTVLLIDWLQKAIFLTWIQFSLLGHKLVTCYLQVVQTTTTTTTTTTMTLITKEQYWVKFFSSFFISFKINHIKMKWYSLILDYFRERYLFYFFF